ncbi:hypothetical protein [Tepidimonas taiwanensis]|uniref:hypothetical protein n=1 Tax=Tepidimonas taiwanensis TaxID=307486 RepID=UPI000733C745|nr:hypothetical protein [Tepidimonas taiwanensis]
MDASAVLAGLAILVIGENQIANPGYLLNPLHEALQARGAIVHSLGMCGGFPTRWLDGPPTACGAAERKGADPARVNWGETPHWFDLRAIVPSARPAAVVVVIHETLAAYDRPEMDAEWARHEVRSLANYLAQERVTCYWVGPGWGDPHKRYHKTPERVQTVAELIRDASPPCRFIDSLSFAAPGEWKTINGRDYTVKGYRAWANAIADAIAQQPPASMR